MSEHSPEPWVHEPENDDDGFLEIVDADGMVVCLGEGVLSEADARRIALNSGEQKEAARRILFSVSSLTAISVAAHDPKAMSLSGVVRHLPFG